MGLFLHTLVVVLCIIVIGPSTIAFCMHEWTRWLESVDECKASALSDQRILSTKMCSDAWERRQFGADVDNVCTKAEANQRISHMGCVTRTFWRKSVFYEVYLLFTVYPWVIFIMLTVCIMYIIHQVFASWNQNRVEERSERMYIAALDKFKTVSPPPPLEYEDVPIAKPRKQKVPLIRGRSYVDLARPPRFL